jgi:hypothetical protein
MPVPEEALMTERSSEGKGFRRLKRSGVDVFNTIGEGYGSVAYHSLKHRNKVLRNQIKLELFDLADGVIDLRNLNVVRVVD